MTTRQVTIDTYTSGRVYGGKRPVPPGVSTKLAARRAPSGDDNESVAADVRRAIVAKHPKASEAKLKALFYARCMEDDALLRDALYSYMGQYIHQLRRGPVQPRRQWTTPEAVENGRSAADQAARAARDALVARITLNAMSPAGKVWSDCTREDFGALGGLGFKLMHLVPPGKTLGDVFKDDAALRKALE